MESREGHTRTYHGSACEILQVSHLCVHRQNERDGERCGGAFRLYGMDWETSVACGRHLFGWHDSAR